MGPTHSKSPFPCSVSRRAQNPPVPENRIFGDYAEPTHTSKSAGRQRTSPRALVPLTRSPPPASQRRQPPTSLPLSICHSSLSSADSLSSPSSLPRWRTSAARRRPRTGWRPTWQRQERKERPEVCLQIWIGG